MTGKLIIPIRKMRDRRESTNYRGISLLNLPEKMYAKRLEKRHREITETKLEDAQWFSSWHHRPNFNSAENFRQIV